eukprot:7162658-Pyramimonas_sp.AAC.1
MPPLTRTSFFTWAPSWHGPLAAASEAPQRLCDERSIRPGRSREPCHKADDGSRDSGHHERRDSRRRPLQLRP